MTDRPWHDSIVRAGREPSRGTGSVVEQRVGYTVRTRGDIGGWIEHEYECPVHGRFSRTMKRHVIEDVIQCARGWQTNEATKCTEWATWVPPLVGIGRAAGEVDS